MTSLNYGNNPGYVGLSTDEKPMDATEGSLFHEIDTAQDYRFNGTTKAWELQTSNRWWMTYYEN